VKRVLAIDPGSKTGFVVVDFELAPGLDITQARLVGSGVIYNAGGSAEESKAERDILFIGRIAERIAEFRPSTVVLEEPEDAAAYWGRSEVDGERFSVADLATGKAKNSKAHKGMARGTLFRLGVNYGLALAAVKVAGHADVVSYPVQGSKTRQGWQGHGAKKVNILREMRYLFAKLSYTPLAQVKCSEHELMALGVLNFHASQLNLVVPRGTR
jgi:hypothetical protein